MLAAMSRHLRGLVGHVEQLSAQSLLPIWLGDPDLVVQMDLVRDIASAAKSVREARGLRRRLPLHTLTVSLADSAGTSLAMSIVTARVEAPAMPTSPTPHASSERATTAGSRAHRHGPKARPATSGRRTFSSGSPAGTRSGGAAARMPCTTAP